VKDVLAILRKEWRNFVGSEKGVFAVYAILVFVWSFLPLYNNLGSFALGGAVWWLFFSVIVSGNFANTVFVAERMSGSMEILLTSGFSRNGVLFGKVLFVMIMSGVIGALCFCLSIAWIGLSGHAALLFGPSLLYAVALYASGTFLNAAAGAWMSIRLSSPRLIPFVNILLVGVVCGVYYALFFTACMSAWALPALLLAVGCVFCALAKRDFNGEKIIAPVDV
jgi:ABC-type transport system involved in multi-copper enzyme maturation permease subunit